jgi:uncharacterized membrane protein YhiD involved in acid resistance
VPRASGEWHDHAGLYCSSSIGALGGFDASVSALASTNTAVIVVVMSVRLREFAMGCGAV